MCGVWRGDTRETEAYGDMENSHSEILEGRCEDMGTRTGRMERPMKRVSQGLLACLLTRPIDGLLIGAGSQCLYGQILLETEI